MEPRSFRLCIGCSTTELPDCARGGGGDAKLDNGGGERRGFGIFEKKSGRGERREKLKTKVMIVRHENTRQRKWKLKKTDTQETNCSLSNPYQFILIDNYYIKRTEW